MVESDHSQYWEEEEEDGSDNEIFMSDSLNNQSSQPSGQSYLNEDYIINNFSVSQQGKDAADSSSNSWLPIGLRMDTSSTFLNTVQRSVLKGKTKTKSNDHKSEKLKAGNFPAASIKIGNWQRVSRHEGDLTAKLYYAKRKLVWEVLEGALKYKIEMQWSEISAIRAVMPENHPGTLEVELSQPPLYFQENNPQPKKHTLWRQTSDFTGGHAPVWRRHVVSFKPGILDKHYERLLQCNQRLFDMSLKPFPSHKSPYFDPTFGISEMSLSFSKPYESSYYQSYSAPPTQTPLTLPPPMSVMNIPYTNDGESMSSNHYMSHQPHPQPTPWDEGSSHNNQVYNQYPIYYQPPHVEILNNVRNQMLGDQSHVPLSHHNHCTIRANVDPLNEPTGVINQGYDFASYSRTGHQYQYAPVTDGFYSDTTPAQQYSDNNGIINYQGSSSLNPYYYPGYNPTSGNFF